MRRVIWLGLSLGALSRVEELTPGFSIGLSSDGAWLAAAFVAGLLSGGTTWTAAVRGAVALSGANAGYYLFIALTQSGAARTGIADVAGYWLVLGLTGGALFGAAGRLALADGVLIRAAASLLLAGALVGEGGSAVSRGNPGGAIEIALGCAVPLVLAGHRTAGRLAAAACAALAAVALTGVFVPLVP